MSLYPEYPEYPRVPSSHKGTETILTMKPTVLPDGSTANVCKLECGVVTIEGLTDEQGHKLAFLLLSLVSALPGDVAERAIVRAGHEYARESLIKARYEREEKTKKALREAMDLLEGPQWIVGQYRGKDPKSGVTAWELTGLFPKEEEALAACKDETYFLGPCKYGEQHHDPTTWEGLRFPIIPERRLETVPERSVQYVDGFPRRSRLDCQTPVEAAIRKAVDAVEAAGAHPLLTDAVILLGDALAKVADFTELPGLDEHQRVPKMSQPVPKSDAGPDIADGDDLN